MNNKHGVKPMKIKTTEKYEAVVIELRGNVMGGVETNEFHEIIKSSIADNKKNLIVDLADVKFMNSTGLGMLISAFASVKNAEGRLVLANATEKINSLLVITKLITIFENYDSVEKAVESFKK